MHNKIVTLTLNPVIDKNVTVAGIAPNTKLRCSAPTYYAGGGGINVSRAIKKLGGDSLCAYLAGGPTGEHLRQLLNETGIDQLVVPIKGWTRDNLSVTDTITKQQYRFGVPGPKVDKEEWEALLDQLEKKLEEGDYLVGSGKLPPGMPNDFYVQLAGMAERKNVRFVLDTSGEALTKAAK